MQISQNGRARMYKGVIMLKNEVNMGEFEQLPLPCQINLVSNKLHIHSLPR